MRVSGFMVPADKVVTVSPTESVRKVLDLMLEKKIGAIVVIQNEKKDGETMLPMPAGIITNSDIVKAYQSQDVGMDDPCTKMMGSIDLVTCTPNDSRDKVAQILEKKHNHHVIVVDEEHAHFVGLVSSWDIAAECAKDDRAWPYLRNEETGKIELPPKKEHHESDPPPPPYDPQKPTTILNHPHEEFTTYMDDLDLVGIQ